jgi:hypothetical protein
MLYVPWNSYWIWWWCTKSHIIPMDDIWRRWLNWGRKIIFWVWLAHRLGLSRCVAFLHALPCVPAHSDPMSSSNHGYWSLSHRRTRGEKKSRTRNCSEMTSNASRKSASGCIFLCVLLSWGTITSHTLRDSPGGFGASVDLKKPSRLLRTQWAHHPGEKAEQTRTRRPGGPPPPIRQ